MMNGNNNGVGLTTNQKVGLGMGIAIGGLAGLLGLFQAVQGFQAVYTNTKTLIDDKKLINSLETKDDSVVIDSDIINDSVADM